jgi:hypothetical protein
MASIDALLTALAKEHLHIETLETRNSDSLDFHDVAVWSVRDALLAAYKAGKAATKPNYENSKHKILIDMLGGEAGATLQQMADATGWQKSSVSCALSNVLKTKRRLNVTCTREAGKDPVYRIIAPKKGA